MEGRSRIKEKTERITFDCDISLKDRLWEIADSNECNLSDVIRYALKKFVKTMGEENEN